jgi:hypothetical protein
MSRANDIRLEIDVLAAEEMRLFKAMPYKMGAAAPEYSRLIYIRKQLVKLNDELERIEREP